MIHPSITHRLRMISQIYGLPMNANEQLMLGMVFTLLADVQRYKGGVHLPRAARDNTCEHTFASLRLAGRVFAEAGTHDSLLKQQILHMITVHDFGEAFGEFTSLDSRVKAAKRFKIGKMAERDITDFVLSWAMHLHHAPERFFSMMRGIQSSVMYSDEPEAMAHVALDALRQYGLPSLDTTAQRHVDRWMHYFNEVEGLSGGSFASAAAKMIEKLQSQEHFATHCGTGDSLPFSHATSASTIATLSYAERKLGDVFARATNKDEYAIAEALRTRCYANIITILKSMPALVDMQRPETTPEAGSDARGPFVQRLLLQHRALRSSRDDGPLGIETRYRISDWYTKAIHDGYVPKPDESLIDRYLRPEARIVALRA